MKKNTLLGWIVLLVFPVLLSAQDTKAVQSSAAEPDDYVIGMTDILSISVWKEPELSVKELVVRPDGKISLPLVNDIQANGLTPNQLREKIADKLKEFVENPNVNVTVIRTSSYTVSVVGQVNRPGPYTVAQPTTVLEIMAQVGGLSEWAKEKDIKILRKENGRTRQFPFNYKDVIRGKNLDQNITLKNGDIILVP